MELLKVLFSLNKTTEQIPLPGQVIISPVETSWNDFGFKIRCEFKVRISEKHSPVEGSMFIGFLSPDNLSESEIDDFYEKRDSLTSHILRSGQDIVTKNMLPPFFTMLPDLQGYRDLYDNLGDKGLALFLRCVNDLVFHKQSSENWMKRAIETEVFKLGFMRNSEPFFAFYNADSVIAGEELRNNSTISNILNLEFKLSGFVNSHQLDFKYQPDSIIPKRIGVIIGKNGVGKSESLKAFCRGALQHKDKGLSLTDSDGKRPMINRLIAITSPGEASNTFPSERRATQKLYYRRLNLSSKGNSLGQCLLQLARGEERIGGLTRKEIFSKMLREAGLDTEHICVQLKSKHYLGLSHFVYGGGEQDKLTWWANVDPNAEPKTSRNGEYFSLSSGQLTFFRFALLCCLYIENGSFVLLDEPETHMHPNMIATFIGLLDHLLKLTGSQALIATHSTYIVREVPTEQVLVLSVEEDEVQTNRPRLPTFGATVDSISQFVFNEDTETRLTEKLYNRLKGENFADYEYELSNELSLSALMRLKRMMESEV